MRWTASWTGCSPKGWSSAGSGTGRWPAWSGSGSPEQGFGFLPAEPYRSLTLTCATNTRNLDLAKLKKMLGERGYAFDDGYGKLKGKTFRIPHMGDMQPEGIREFLDCVEGCIAEL